MIPILIATAQQSVSGGDTNHLALALGLLILACALAVLEIFIISGGILSVAAAITAVFAIYNAFLFDTTTGWIFLIGTPIGAVYLIRWGLQRLADSPLVAHSAVTARSGYGTNHNGDGLAVGSQGVLLTPARPCGRARFGTVVIDIDIQGGSAEIGDSIEIIEIQGPRILAVVIPAPPTSPSPERPKEP